MQTAVTGFLSARPRLICATLVGLVGGVCAPGEWQWVGRTLVGWNTGVYVYLLLILTMMARADAGRVRTIAARQDETAYVSLVLLSGAALMSLVAIVFELATVRQSVSTHAVHVLLTAITVIGSWVFIPTVFGMHYAHVFYRDPDHPALRFPDEGVEPNYWEFLYFSFTIAVASQTADVSVASREMRKLVLAQALMSFVFNASILALTINISATLLTPG